MVEQIFRLIQKAEYYCAENVNIYMSPKDYKRFFTEANSLCVNPNFERRIAFFWGYPIVICEELPQGMVVVGNIIKEDNQ